MNHVYRQGQTREAYIRAQRHHPAAQLLPALQQISLITRLRQLRKAFGKSVASSLLSVSGSRGTFSACCGAPVHLTKRQQVAWSDKAEVTASGVNIKDDVKANNQLLMYLDKVSAEASQQWRRNIFMRAAACIGERKVALGNMTDREKNFRKFHNDLLI